MPPVYGVHDDNQAATGLYCLRLLGKFLFRDVLQSHIKCQVKVYSARRLRVGVWVGAYRPASCIPCSIGTKRLCRQ